MKDEEHERPGQHALLRSYKHQHRQRTSERTMTSFLI